MATILLGIEGHKQAGKDTFAERLTARRGYTRIAFADPLRRVALSIDPVIIPLDPDVTPRYADQPDPNLDARFRRVVQDELEIAQGGTAEQARSALRALNPYVGIGQRLCDVIPEIGWDAAKESIPEVRRLLQYLGTECIRAHYGDDTWASRGLSEAARVDGPVVITDVRFPNEARAIQDAGGYLVRIMRSDRDVSGDRAHASEALIDLLPADLEVANDASIAHLWRKADALADALSAKKAA